MMTQGLGLSLLLLLTVAASFLLGWRFNQKRSNAFKQTFAHSYYRGMSYLLNEQMDNSVDKFIDSLEVTGETLEIHLALGNMMRRKGEAAKAIRIHQNVLEKRDLTSKQHHEAQLELARDYVSAGLLDRAESLFQELIQLDSFYKTQALEQLIEIYQDEKEWSKAIHSANMLSRLKGNKEPRELAIAKAHFCCELALQNIEKDALESAAQHLEQAIAFDKNSVRASLISAELAYRSGDYETALAILKKIPEQDPERINITLPLLCDVYEKLKDSDGLQETLKEWLERYPTNQLVIQLADKIRATQDDYAAANFIAEQLKRKPSIKALNRLVELHLLHSEGEAKENLQLLKQLVDKVIAEKPAYHCIKCGFSGAHLHWLCPGCKTWGSVKIIKGVAGE